MQATLLNNFCSKICKFNIFNPSPKTWHSIFFFKKKMNVKCLHFNLFTQSIHISCWKHNSSNGAVRYHFQDLVFPNNKWRAHLQETPMVCTQNLKWGNLCLEASVQRPKISNIWKKNILSDEKKKQGRTLLSHAQKQASLLVHHTLFSSWEDKNNRQV